MSGPLSIYRMTHVLSFLDAWLLQKYMGKFCTFGDDRHLTNCMLKEKAKTVYTPYAKCSTETPSGISRFLQQQLRWNKSSIREMTWTTKVLRHHSHWMTVDVAYQTLYSLFILGSILYILFAGTLNNLITYCYGLVIISLLRSLYGAIMEESAKYLLYTYYCIIYISLIIPVRLYAFLQLFDHSWGSKTRRDEGTEEAPTYSCPTHEWIPVVLWNVLMISGVTQRVVRSRDNITTNQITLLWILPLIFISMYAIIQIIRYGAATTLAPRGAFSGS